MPSRFPFIRGCNGKFSNRSLLHCNVDDWLIYWLVYLLIYGLIDKITGWLIDWIINRLVDWMIDWSIWWLIDRLDDWLNDWLIDWMVDWLIYRYLLVIYWWLEEVDLLIQETNIINFLFLHNHKILVQKRKKTLTFFH